MNAIESREMLVDLGVELIHDYGFKRNEQEFEIFKEKKGEIQTDFWGFGNNYAIALKHMKEYLPDVQKVVDIGCCWGVFSYMFKDYHYVGLDESTRIEKEEVFKYYPHHEYKQGCFPFINPGGDVFISSMSLGYGGAFNNYRENEDVIRLFLEEISTFKYGYMKASNWVEELVEERFERTHLEQGMSFWKRRDR